MTNKVKALLEKISGDEKLQEEFKALKEKEEVIAKAQELGLELTEEDLTPPEGEVSEKDLAEVAGGNDDCVFMGGGWCLCPLAGGGGGTQADGDTWGCACTLYGQGGDGHEDHTICICPIGGVGEDKDE